MRGASGFACTHATRRVASTTVSRKRLVRSAVALVVAIGVQASHGAPLRSIAAIHAVRCCATDCHHGGTADTARACCGVERDDPGVLGAASPPPAPDTAPLPVVFDLAPPAPLARSSVDGVPAAARAAPLFLLTETLRL
jgi:hypothetical protein